MDYPTPTSVPRTNRFKASAPIAIPRRRNRSPPPIPPRRRPQSPELIFPMSPLTSEYPVFSPEDEDEKPFLYPFPSLASLLASHTPTSNSSGSRSSTPHHDENSSEGSLSPRAPNLVKSQSGQHISHASNLLTPLDQNLIRTPMVQIGFTPLHSDALFDCDSTPTAVSKARPRRHPSSPPPPPSHRGSFSSSPWIHVGAGPAGRAGARQFYRDAGRSTLQHEMAGILDFDNYLTRRNEDRRAVRIREVKAMRPAGAALA